MGGAGRRPKGDEAPVTAALSQAAGKLRALRRFLPLLRELVVRDIKVRYRRSALGLVWTVLHPLLMMTVITFVFSRLFRQSVENYPIYYLSGSILFSFNSEATTTALGSIYSNASLIKKVYIPKYLFPLSNVLSALINLGFSFIAMLLVMLVTGAPFHAPLLLAPAPVFYAFLFSAGLGIFLSAVTVFFRDIAHFYSGFLLAWTYLTPIFYPEDILPAAALRLMQFNPMYHFVHFLRSLVLYGTLPGWEENVLCLGMGLSMLVLGLFIFYKTQDRFVLYV